MISKQKMISTAVAAITAGIVTFIILYFIASTQIAAWAAVLSALVVGAFAFNVE